MLISKLIIEKLDSYQQQQQETQFDTDLNKDLYSKL